MKKINLILIAALAVFAVAVSSCKKKKEDPTDEPSTPTTTVETLEGNIASSITLDASKKYLIKGKVYVQSPAVLTIPAGTLIMGDKATQGTLIINRGAKIEANGTASQPIVMTSSGPAGFRNRGDWGGVIILGHAANNSSNNVTIEGIASSTGENGLHGPGAGAVQNTESSGTLRFVRIEYAGIPLADDNELNSLTMGSVGSGTVIENIMVSYANDDAYEWFGGTVNAKYLIAYSTWDDDLDTDMGFTGKVQFAYVVRDPAIADKSGSRAWESSSSSANASPASAPIFSNVTVLGPLVYAENHSSNKVNSLYRGGIEINSNSNIEIHNSIVLGFGVPSYNEITTSTPGTSSKVENVVLARAIGASNGTGRVVDSLEHIYGSTYAAYKLQPNGVAGATNNLALRADSKIGYNVKVPNPVLSSTSPYKSGAPAVAAFASTPAYYGAFGETIDAGWQWNSGWVDFTPNTNNY